MSKEGHWFRLQHRLPSSERLVKKRSGVQYGRIHRGDPLSAGSLQRALRDGALPQGSQVGRCVMTVDPSRGEKARAGLPSM